MEDPSARMANLWRMRHNWRIDGARMLRSGALNPFDGNKVSQSYSLILVILFFLDALSSNAMFLSDQSGFTGVNNISMVFLAVGMQSSN